MKNTTPNIELMKDAYAIIDGIPEDRFDLIEWQNSGSRYTPQMGFKIIIAPRISRTNCKTIACAAGWLSLHPQMRALGLRNEPCVGAPVFGRGNQRREGPGAMARLFNIADFEALALFQRRQLNETKAEFPTDKQLWLSRMKEFITSRDDFNMSRYGYLKYQYGSY